MQKTQQEIVNLLLDSYRDIGGINHLDCGDLPSKIGIATLCEDLLCLLFPGFFDYEAVASTEISMRTNELVAGIRERLSVELRSVLRAQNGGNGDHGAKADDVCCKFFNSFPEVRQLLQTDVQAAYEGDPAAKSYDEIILAYPGLEAIAIQRLAHLLYSEGVPLIPRMMTEWAHSKTGIDIHPGAQIGSHFFIDHGTGVVIGETCVIGTRVKLYHGVTLGARSFTKDEDGHIVKGIKRHPNVEDDVTVYPNSTILGGDTTLGARSTIGANVFLMQSVDPDTLVIRGEQPNRSLDKRVGKKKQKADPFEEWAFQI
ncbi:serine acetyltransferase [Phragmitibacter flavus]|uniref:Serine acetyltransferase n=1 Tax=Phragmitibacter flavus TaxID=2576071 RepID=A0A5R8KIW9_9BACT|nr:serine O-acetyltransferase EpsC [Phragmitibacter flavus]TLD72200.1 serine acetyltransferase [Phragmitibacter flavus]